MLPKLLRKAGTVTWTNLLLSQQLTINLSLFIGLCLYYIVEYAAKAVECERFDRDCNDNHVYHTTDMQIASSQCAERTILIIIIIIGELIN
jgi:hypothetical protein